MNLLVDAGVRTFVDLTEDGELAPYEPYVLAAADARRLDLRHLRHAIPDLSVVEDDRYDAIVDSIRAEADRGAVFVHCWGGIGRTGTVVGCLLVDAGAEHADAIARLAELRRGTRKAHKGRRRPIVSATSTAAGQHAHHADPRAHALVPKVTETRSPRTQ